VKYKIFILILPVYLYAADMNMFDPKTAAMFNSIADPKKPEASPQQQEAKPSEMMVIDPKDRAKDFKAAFDILRINQTQSKITYFLEDKSQISGIMEVSILPGGTMLSFRLASTKGISYKIVPVEQIKSIGL
jgi:hypothetical protein